MLFVVVLVYFCFVFCDIVIDFVWVFCVFGVVFLYVIMVGVMVLEGGFFFENVSDGIVWIVFFSWFL